MKSLRWLVLLVVTGFMMTIHVAGVGQQRGDFTSMVFPGFGLRSDLYTRRTSGYDTT
jgi:hypothetical protein